MKEEETIRLTYRNLHDLKTDSGGFTKATVNSLGITWPPQKGWLKELIGKTIPKTAYIEAEKGRSIHIK